MTVIQDFEAEFQRFTGAQHAIAVSSGTAALHIALLSCGIAKGDTVITTPFTHISTVNAILYCGAKPVFADINPATYCMAWNAVNDQVEKHPAVKAILCVHLFGETCHLSRIRETAEANNLRFIEDCAQAFGVNYQSQHVGTFGDFGTFSFYASKNLWTFEGGMLTTNNDRLAHKARLLRSHGQDRKYHHVTLGYNYRMPQNCALLGLTMLRLHKKGILSELGTYGIEQGHYPAVVYEQPIYRKLGITGDCPNAERAAAEARQHFEQKYGSWDS